MKHSAVYPFAVYQTDDGSQFERAEIPLRITNPIDGGCYITFALIDTGADSCLIPQNIVAELNHNLKGDGVESTCTSGVGGKSATYKHTFNIELLNHDREQAVWSAENILIDCIEADIPLLLGVEDFLKHFELTINYPEKLITLRWD